MDANDQSKKGPVPEFGIENKKKQNQKLQMVVILP
jgi:hypothetical protein